MIRYYLVPEVVEVLDATLGTTYRYAKYLFSRKGQNVDVVFPAGTIAEAKDFGVQSAFCIAVQDATDPQDAAMRGKADVCWFADNLDTAVGPDLARLQAGLELYNLPAEMVTAATTYRRVLRGTLGILALAQCMAGYGRNIFAPGVTLDTTLGAFSAAVRADLQACFDALGYSSAGFTLATTVRQVYAAISQQTPAGPTTMMLGVRV